MVNTDNWFIRTKSKSFWKRLFREKDVVVNQKELDKRNEELENKFTESNKKLLDGFCPFTNLGNCRSDCNHFFLGRVVEAGKDSVFEGSIHVGSIIHSKCKLWKN